MKKLSACSCFHLLILCVFGCFFVLSCPVVFAQESQSKEEEVIPSNKTGILPSDSAVHQGLDWLMRHQDSEGFWDSDNFARGQAEKKGQGVGRGNPLNDVGVTGLALLAFLEAGHTPLEGSFKKVVRKGIKYLCEIQDEEDGCLTTKESQYFMYNHGIGALALVEAYGRTKWEPLKKNVLMALEFIHNSKNPGKAWRYNRGEKDPELQNDVSVTGWMMRCIAKSKDYDLPYHKKDIQEGLLFMDEMTDVKTGRTGYMTRGSFSSREAGDEMIWPFDQVEAMTAVAMVCRLLFKDMSKDSELQNTLLEKGTALLKDKRPRWDEKAGCIDYYYWYYGTLALSQKGGKEWGSWREGLVQALIEHQHQDGDKKGSWDPQKDPWGDHGGRIYSTALCTLCLALCD